MLDYSYEVWRPIKGFKGYEASNMGRIKTPDRYVRVRNNKTRLHKGTILPGDGGTARTTIVLINNKVRKLFFVHRVIALTFCNNPHNNPCVNHKNNDCADHRSENLEWVTQSQNKRHGYMVSNLPFEERFGVFEDDGYAFSAPYMYFLRARQGHTSLSHTTIARINDAVKELTE